MRFYPYSHKYQTLIILKYLLGFYQIYHYTIQEHRRILT